MGDKVDGLCEKSKLDCHLGETNVAWRQDVEVQQSEVNSPQDRSSEVKVGIQTSGDNMKNELDLLSRRVRITTTVFAYLKSKARVLSVPHLAHASCGIKHRDGVGFVDKNDVPLSDWSINADHSSLECSDEILPASSSTLEPSNVSDGAYVGELFHSVQIVTDAMESLVKRVIVAESEVDTVKEKLGHSKEEIRKKALQIASMSAKVEEMEIFALGTNSLLNEMRQKVEDMVLETSLQRQRAADNEQELRRVKQDFESLRSYVSGLISVRENLLSSEQQFQSMEKLFDRLFAKTTHLEAEKEQKEAEVQKLLAENAHLSSMLDKKEAQLLAMSEQCKFMALKRPDY